MMFKGSGKIIILILFCCSGILAQNKRILDSLNQNFITATHDSIKAKLLIEMSLQVKISNPDSGIILAQRGVELAEDNNMPFTIARGWFAIAIANHNQGKYEEEIKIMEEVFGMYKKMGRKKEMANVYINLGLAYNGKSDFARALDCDYKALKIFEEIKDEGGQALALGNIGISHYMNKSFDKCIEYTKKALAIDQKLGNEKSVARHLGNIGSIYFEQGKLLKKEGNEKGWKEKDSLALENLLEALAMAEKQNNKSGMAMHIGNIANVFFGKGDTAKTLEYYNKALKIFESMNDKIGISRMQGNIGWFYQIQKKHKEAEAYTKEAIKSLEGTGNMDLLTLWENNLSSLYEDAGDYKNALDHYRTGIKLRDSVFSIETTKKALETEMQFELDKKEAISKEENARQALIRNVFIAGFVLMFIMAALILRSYRIKQKANKLVSQQKELLEVKNKEITDSIHYAKRIQNAHLPSNEYITKKLSELKNKS